MQGMKKHKLLREDILPAMASNRKVQRLLNEFMELLSEYDLSETSLGQNTVVPAVSVPTADKMDTDLPGAENKPSSSAVTDQENVETPAAAAAAADQMDIALETPPPATEQVDSAIQETTKEKPDTAVIPQSNEMNLDPPPSDESNPCPPPEDKGS